MNTSKREIQMFQHARLKRAKTNNRKIGINDKNNKTFTALKIQMSF